MISRAETANSPGTANSTRGVGIRRRAAVTTATLLLCTASLACDSANQPQPGTSQPIGNQAETAPDSDQPDDAFAELRQDMVRTQLQARDITDQRVLNAMGKVPRQQFVPPEVAAFAYRDGPLPIGRGQTISQPYIVALMTQLAAPGPQAKVLDVGTGSGYQAAILGELTAEVYSIEIICELAESAKQRLAELGYDNITVRCGDGYNGWPDQAPFDAIIVAAAPDHVPEPLIDQLAAGGRLVIPVGDQSQKLLQIQKDSAGRVTRKTIAPVAFVPFTRDESGGTAAP